MKRVHIGDIHGRTIWERIVSKHPDADELIIYGDYFDCYPNEQRPFSLQERNFHNLMELTASSKSNVVFLLGNHDLHYIADVSPCSRFDEKNHLRIRELFTEYAGQFDIIHQYDNVLCSHAGVSNAWLDWKLGSWDVDNVTHHVRDLFQDPKHFDYNGNGFKYDHIEVGRIYESPMWLRPHSLHFADNINGDLRNKYIQVFGHTQVHDMFLIEEDMIKLRKGRHHMVDALGAFEPGYLLHVEGEFIPQHIV
jgi:hypothetical protein